MSHSTHTALAAFVALAVAASPAAATDLRSPDAHDAAAATVVRTTDLRSPDARDAASPAVTPPTDLRSPDARDAAAPARPVVAHPSSDGLAWGYLAVGLVGVALLGGVVASTRRRRVKHAVVAG